MTRMSENYCWNFLPSVIIVRIFSFLPFKDRLLASMTCKTWRECLFAPSLWPKAHFKISSCDNQGKMSNDSFMPISSAKVSKGAQFLANKCGRFVREANIEFNPMNPYDVKILIDILEILSTNRKIEIFNLKPKHYNLEMFDMDTSEESHLAKALDPLSRMIQNAQRLRHFSFGLLEDLNEYSEIFLSLLSQYHSKSLQSLHLASIKKDPEMYNIVDFPSECFDSFLNLKILSIDYDFLSDSLLHSLAKSYKHPLESFHIYVHGIDSDHPGTSDSAWKMLSDHSPFLEVTLTLLHSNDSWLVDILHPTMPLVHLYAFFSCAVDCHFIDMLTAYNHRTLQSIHLVDSLTPRRTPSNFFFNDDEVENPLVMLAWKCHKLQSIYLIGYEIKLYDLVGIARLRGPNLRQLIIPACCIVTQKYGSLYRLSNSWPDLLRASFKDISQSLAQTWEPIADDEIDPALFNATFDLDPAYFNILVEDHSWKSN